MIMARAFLTFILFISVFGVVRPDKKSDNGTSYFLKAGAGASFGLHNARFKQFPDFKLVGGDFNNATSINPYFNIGYEYKFEERYFSILERYGIDLEFKPVSVLLKKKTLVGNIISENSYYEGFSRQEIDPSIVFLTLSPKLIFSPIDDLPLDVSLGISIGTPIIAKFNQNEAPLGDFDIEYSKNDPNMNDKEIPDMNPIYSSLDLGLRYKFYKTKNFDFMADVQGSLALQNIVKDVQWNANSISIGISVLYNIQKKSIPPPIPPPSPAPAPVKKPVEIVAPEISQAINITYNDKIVSEGNVIEFSYLKNIYKEKYSILPLLYYKAKSTQQQGKETQGLEGRAQKELLSSVAKYLERYSDVTIEIEGVSSENRESMIIEKRADILFDSLLSYGLSRDRIKILVNYKDSVEYKYDELKEEEEKIEIKFSDGNKLVEFLLSEKTSYYSEENNTIDIEVKSNYKEFQSGVEILIDDDYAKENLINNISSHRYRIDLNEYLKGNAAGNLSILSRVKSGEKENEIKLNLRIEKNIKENIIINEIKASGKSEKTYILGYFGFDSSEFKAIDQEVRQMVRDAIESGATVKFLPLTDNLGDESHNRDLAEKRARSALNLFQNKEAINVEIPLKSYFSNDHPYGRTLNRSVVVKIITRN